MLPAYTHVYPTLTVHVHVMSCGRWKTLHGSSPSTVTACHRGADNGLDCSRVGERCCYSEIGIRWYQHRDHQAEWRLRTECCGGEERAGAAGGSLALRKSDGQIPRASASLHACACMPWQNLVPGMSHSHSGDFLSDWHCWAIAYAPARGFTASEVA